MESASVRSEPLTRLCSRSNWTRPETGLHSKQVSSDRNLAKSRALTRSKNQRRATLWISSICLCTWSTGFKVKNLPEYTNAQEEQAQLKQLLERGPPYINFGHCRWSGQLCASASCSARRQAGVPSLNSASKLTANAVHHAWILWQAPLSGLRSFQSLHFR